MILKALKTTLIFKERLSPAYLSAVDLPNQHSSQVYQLKNHLALLKSPPFIPLCGRNPTTTPQTAIRMNLTRSFLIQRIKTLCNTYWKKSIYTHTGHFIGYTWL